MRPAAMGGWICNGGEPSMHGQGCETHQAVNGTRSRGPWWKESAHERQRRSAVSPVVVVPPGVAFSPADAAFAETCCSTVIAPPDPVCGWFSVGANSRCVKCDHDRLCHPKGCWSAAYDRDQSVTAPPEFTASAHQLAFERCTQLESAIDEWISASDMPARSSDAGETSVWLARSVSAENALRALVGTGPKEPQATGLLERAQQLEAELAKARETVAFFTTATGPDFDLDSELELREADLGLTRLVADTMRAVGLLAPAIRTVDGVTDDGLTSCATRAAQLIRWAAELRAALAGILAQRRTSEGYASAEEQDVVREARRVLGTGGRL